MTNFVWGESYNDAHEEEDSVERKQRRKLRIESRLILREKEAAVAANAKEKASEQANAVQIQQIGEARAQRKKGTGTKKKNLGTGTKRKKLAKWRVEEVQPIEEEISW